MKSGIFLILLLIIIGQAHAEDSIIERNLMIEDQIIARGVKDKRVIAAMRKVERHLFVPKDVQARAYGDYPLPIGKGQTISQPYIVAYMTEQLNLKPTDRVLEIGTGSGYQTAILAELVGHVYTIEIVPQLARNANKLLTTLGYTNISFQEGNGYEGWPQAAPFDAIMITAAPPQIPPILLDQLKVGGRLIVPTGKEQQYLYMIVRTEQGFEQQPLIAVNFVPMVKE